MTLRDDLMELSEVLPLLPGEVGALADVLRTLVEAASAAIHDVTDVRQHIIDSLTHVHSALPPLSVETEALEGRVDAAADAAEKAWSEGQAELARGEEGLAESHGHADTAGRELAGGLTAAAELVAGAEAPGDMGVSSMSPGDMAVSDIQDASSKGREAVASARNDVDERLFDLRTILDELGETLAGPAEDLLAAAEQFANNAGADTDAILEHVSIRINDYSEQVEDVAHEVPTESETVLVPFGTWAYDEVSTALATAVQRLQVELEAVAAAAASQREAAAGARDRHASALDDLKEKADPLPGAIDDIHEAVKRMRQP